MTAPIQEGSVYRTQSGHTWGISQLARRPQISSGCPCEFQWARVEGTSTISAADDTPTQISWNTYAIDPDADAFSINTADAPYTILRAGWFLVFLDFEWNVTGYSDERFYEITGSVSDIAVNGNSSMYVNQSGDYESGVQFHWLNHLRPGNGPLKLIVTQRSGVSKDINTGSLSIIFLGPGGGIDDGTTLMDDIRVDF